MPARLEIRLKDELFDAEGNGIKKKAREYLGLDVDNIRVVRVITIDKEFNQKELERIRREIFTNPVTESSSYMPISRDFDWIIWVGFRPGVKDSPGETAVEAIEDLLGIRFEKGEAVYTSKIYEIKGRLELDQVKRIAQELLANELIQQWRVVFKDEWDHNEGIGIIIPKVILRHTPEVKKFSIGSDDDLKKISIERGLALNERDIPVIRRYFMKQEILQEREKIGLDLPTDVELEYISQARSDHCNHNTFKGLFRYRDLATGETVTVNNLFKTCIEEPTLRIRDKKDWVVSVLWDNAGVGRFDNNHNYTIKGETHNSPSTMEAYGGSLTGIVGVYRDPLGTGKGSKVICGGYAFCVGPRDYDGPLKPYLHPKRLLDGVVEGVRDGGNKSGIPTAYGLLLFDESYIGKCLVFVVAAGIMPAMIKGEPSYLKTTRKGDLIVMSGGRVGKDGIHGVTAASEEYSEHTPATHVQIGDPYTQKKLHDFLIEARDEGLISFITDCGGGGLSSAIGESAGFSNGCRVELDKVPLKYEGLDPWEIWVSESQERMVIAVRPEHINRFMELSKKHAVESTVIGEYDDAGYLRLYYKEKPCAYIRMDFIKSEFPQWEFDAEWIPPELRGLCEPVIDEPREHGSLLREMLSRPNICERNWIIRQYDHEVQGGSVIKPLVGKGRDVPSDASVIRPILESKRGLAITQSLNPFYSLIDTYHMVTVTVDEAVRKIISVGGDPFHIGGVDNFCWPNIQYDPKKNPDGKYKAAQLVRACLALRDICLEYEIPLLSGKDSMYVDGNLEGPFGEKRKISAIPTMMFTACSVIEDISRCITMDAKRAGDLVYILGKTKDELGASEFYQMMGYVGKNVPKVDMKDSWKYYLRLSKAISERLVSSCHAVGRGGLGVHLALVSMAGELGMEIDLDRVLKEDGLAAAKILYSESAGRFIITVSPEKRGALEDMFADTGCISFVGKVTIDSRLRISYKGKSLIDEDITKLKECWKRPFNSSLA